MFKYSRNTLPEVIRELFITDDTFHSHNARNKNMLRSKMSNREYMYKTLALRAFIFGMIYKITSQLIHHTLNLNQILRTIFNITI